MQFFDVFIKLFFINEKSKIRYQSKNLNDQRSREATSHLFSLPFHNPKGRSSSLSTSLRLLRYSKTSRVNFGQLTTISALWFKIKFIARIQSKYHTTQQFLTFIIYNFIIIILKDLFYHILFIWTKVKYVMKF